MKLQKHLFSAAIAFSSILAIALLFAALDKNASNDIRELFRSDGREVLATVSGAFLGKDSAVTAVKVKTPDGIRLEIYDNKGGDYKLLKKIEIGSRDAFFNFAGRVSNLAADDVDGDNIQEILIPMYDENLVAHLAILKYDPQSQDFERL
ncbi:MAG: hypothetical protein A4S09_05145 [Proteobacteria bacterium SG_bin7]|nr:MAG: hypothetical protein A4S09_05145 [Proteobacteria bacterium SG_bin7]